MSEKIKAEVMKQFNAEFLAVTSYLQWVANVVPTDNAQKQHQCPDTYIVVHRLPTREDCSPIKQKVLRMRPDMSEKIKAEVLKQFNVGFLAVTSYPQWVANIVLVPKKDRKSVV